MQIRTFRFNIDFMANVQYVCTYDLYDGVQYKTGYCYTALFCLHLQTLFMIISLVYYIQFTDTQLCCTFCLPANLK